MPHRHFIDPHARRWTVWDVRPARVEQDLERQRPSHDATGERRSRARGTPWRGGIALEGWLCFECPGLKRRLTPIPTGWERLADEELAQLCERAANVDRRARLLEGGGTAADE